MQKELTKVTKNETSHAPLTLQVQEIMAVITAFSSLLIKETEALKKADFKTVDTLQPGKKLFAKQYQAKVEALVARREEMLNLDLPTREKLLRERARFNTVLNDNMYALDLAQNSTKRLVNHILDAARHAVMEDQQTNYSKLGKTATYKAATTSLSIDQSM